MREYNRIVKIIWHMAYHNPGSYGLFWDDDGTMPLKEFLWVCNLEPELRVINRDYLKRLILLGLDLPFTVEDSKLRLVQPGPAYVQGVPPRILYYGASPASAQVISKKGLSPPSHRSYAGLWVSIENALRYGKPLNKKIPVAVDTLRAQEQGVIFLKTDSDEFYLTSQPIPPEAIHSPPLDERSRKELEDRKKRKEAKSRRRREQQDQRSVGDIVFTPDLAYLRSLYGGDVDEAEAEPKRPKMKDKKRKKGPDWKREARKIRKTKRSL